MSYEIKPSVTFLVEAKNLRNAIEVLRMTLMTSRKAFKRIPFRVPRMARELGFDV